MGTISFIKYYISLFMAYCKFLFTFVIYKFADYPNEIKFAALVSALCVMIIIVMQISIFWMSWLNKRKTKLRERIEKKFGKGMEYIVSSEASEIMSEKEIENAFELDEDRKSVV